MTAAIAPSSFAALPLTEAPALLNLLIVDDERSVREACREAAAALGYRTTSAESAEHALRVIDAHNIDVVLLDLKLPGAGGLEVLRQLKQARPDIEVVVVTGHGTVESVLLFATLVESELFGYVKGAFTGAMQSKEGLLAIAEGGTVFLDEVGELPVDLQAKMLRALQEKEIRPVGSTKQVPINVRILAATNRDLERAVAEGSFRRDLYFRLNVLSLRIPPLRERRQDIPLLATHVLERLTHSTGR